MDLPKQDWPTCGESSWKNDAFHMQNRAGPCRPGPARAGSAIRSIASLYYLRIRVEWLVLWRRYLPRHSYPRRGMREGVSGPVHRDALNPWRVALSRFQASFAG